MKNIAIIILLTLALLQANAQKLPQIQQVSLRAPANARIDGKPTEWVKMQAYNPAGEVYYTIANDDKKLYVVFQSKNKELQSRVINGGITFLAQRSGKKSDVGAVGAKFPYMPDINQRVSFGWNSDNGEADSRYVKAVIKSMTEKIKWIYTIGVLGKDGQIPIYNDEGIQAGATMDSKWVYTCELAFDLSILGLSSDSAKFAYHIIINGEPNKISVPPQQGGGVVKRDGSPVSQYEKEEALRLLNNNLAALSSTPDFWGEYTLAKYKPIMKKVASFLLALFTFLQTNAQKLPQVQQGSLRAPANIKIDGKANDWNNRFEAQNPTTELLYTLANDDNKLYLVAQTDVEAVINRISSGGIKLVIQKNGAKNEDGAAIVKFPYLPKGEILTFSLSNSSMRTRAVAQGNSIFFIRDSNPLSKEEEEKMVDSVMKVNNKKLSGSLKWIYTRGITAVDSLIPIYNDKGIEAGVAFDSKKIYTFEMAIDLKTLGLSAAKADKFSYHLVVNGEPNKYSPVIPPITGATSVDGTPGTAEQLRSANEARYARLAFRGATTDFWGEYTLAK